MTTDPNSLSSLSSQTGRQWLQNSAGRLPEKTDESFVFLSDDAEQTVSKEVPSIHIPDVTSSPGQPTAFDISQTVNPAVVASALAFQAPSSTTNDISEKPSDWADPGATDNPRKTPADQQPTKKGNSNASVDKLCSAILQRFPLGDPSVIVFVGSEPNQHVDETCARVGSQLVDRKIGSVMLIDSDLKTKSMTRASGLENEEGICDVTNRDFDWKTLVYEGSTKNLDFIPAGTQSNFRHPEEKKRLRNAIAEMKQKYQFVIVSAGDAHDTSLPIWNDICDGSYLLVSMKNSNEIYAKSAVAELKARGARLLGCVVTDAA